MSRSLQLLVLFVLVCLASAIHIRDWTKATGDVAVSAWAKDANFYYFGSALGITRVKVSDSSRDLTLPLNSNEAMIHAICLDTNFGYAIINSTTGAQLTVVQFNLGSATNFSRTASLNLFSVEFGQLGGICNFDAATPNSLFVGITHTTLPAQLVQVRIAPFSLSRTGAISLQEGEIQVNTVCVDTAAGVAYYGLNSNKVVAINMAAFTRNNALSGTLNTTATGGATTVSACAFDAANNLLYFGFSNGFIMKVSKTNLASQITAVPLVQSGLVITGLAVDALNQVYGNGRTTTQGVIFRVDVATFQTVNTLVLADAGLAPLPVGNPMTTNTGAALRLSVAHSGTTIVGKMWTYDNTLTRVNVTTDIALNNPLTSAAAPIDDGAGNFWIATTTPAAVIRVRKADWAQTKRCLLNPGDGAPVSIAVDPSTIMIGTATGNIVRFDMNCVRFTWNPINVLGATSRGCTWLLQDSITSSGNVYCVSNSYTAIARINKADQTMQVTRVNFLNEGIAQAAQIDTTNQIVYIMTQNSPNPVLVKIRLSDFVRVSVPTGLFADTVFPMTAAAAIEVDAAGNIYVVSSGASTYVRVYKYSSTFTLLNNGTYSDSQFNDINGFSMNLASNVLYITSAQGAATTPSKLIRVDATTLNRIDSLSLTMSQSPLRVFANQTAAAFKAIVGTTTLTLVGRDAVPVLFSVALCNDGQHFDEATQTCQCCAAGQWLPRESGVCLTCPQGYTCPTTCTSKPVGCAAGTYCPQGSITALPCAAGYTSTFVSGNCTICPAGSYCTNSTLITPCPAGTYQNFTGQTSVSSCTACPVGTYSAAVGATNPVTCVYCPAGQFSTVLAATSSASCVNCYPGSTADPTRTFCTPCTPGTANGVAGGLCGNCAAGTYSNSFGALKCVSCPAGQFNPNTTATYCQLCLPGTAQASVGATSCGDCAAGTYSNIAGAMFCTNCQPGTYQNSTKATTCLPCPAGYSSGTGVGAEAQQYCGACPPGTFSNTIVGTHQCLSCPAGTYNANYNATSCQACPAGYVPNSNTVAPQNLGATACLPCSVGQYKTVAASGDSCISCPAGWYQPNAASSSCLQCPAGTTSNPGSSACTICAPGTFSSGDNVVGGACTACPTGHVSGYGANNCTKCPSGFTSDSAKVTCIACPMGQYGRDGICANCQAGTYQPTTGQTTCMRCPAGTSQPAAGASTCQPCTPGTYISSTGATACINCLEGTYSTGQFQIGFFQIGATQCSLCPAGWTSTAGQSQCTPCATGRYSAVPGSPACEACAAGSANPYVQQTSCQSCPAGTTAVAAALTSCSFCGVDTFNDMVGSPICKNCPTGHFTNVSMGAQSCMNCNDGEILYSPASNSVKQCNKCAPGTYLPVGVKSASCFNCPAGTYATGYGNTVCTPCPAGTSSGSSSATSVAQCSKCAIGFYSSAGSSNCRQCPYGSYSFPASTPGAAVCKFCPAGSFSNINSDGNYGEAVCLPCPAGTYSAREGAHNIINTTTSNNYNIRDSASTQDSCLPCPLGTFAATAGSASCLPCPQSTYSDVAGAASCKACPGNTFNTQFGSTHFNNCSSSCPAGYTNYAQNVTGISKSDSCVACPAGTFWLSFSAPCVACPSGTYNPKIGQTQCFDCANSTAIGSTVCCKSVTNGNSTSIVCSSASFSKMFNPMFILAAILLALSAML